MKNRSVGTQASWQVAFLDVVFQGSNPLPRIALLLVLLAVVGLHVLVVEGIVPIVDVIIGIVRLLVAVVVMVRIFEVALCGRIVLVIVIVVIMINPVIEVVMMWVCCES